MMVKVQRETPQKLNKSTSTKAGWFLCVHDPSLNRNRADTNETDFNDDQSSKGNNSKGIKARVMRRSRNYFQGGGGGPGPTSRKQSGQRFLYILMYLLIVLILNLFYSLQRATNGL